jgi:glycosyltransferase involved in cell wall biosynthesis
MKTLKHLSQIGNILEIYKNIFLKMIMTLKRYFKRWFLIVMILNIIRKQIKKLVKFFYKLSNDKTDLVVFDSFFPHPLSVFRYVEFDIYIQKFKALVYTTGDDLRHIGEKKSIKYFIRRYPFCSRVKLFHIDRNINAKIAVIVFLNNAFYFLPYLEKNKIPFIFTLYPGGGFWMREEESDEKLNRIFNSIYFKKVIVTQNVTRKYLLDNSFCKNEDIEFIYGSPSNWESQEYAYSKRGKREKDTFDICFVAVKYSPKGIDKGYDIFVEVAKKLTKLSEKFRFHVVGGFSANDIDVSDLVSNLKFYGYLSIEELREFYLKQDIIISPNRTNILSKGSFDGFPTGSVVEAGLCGVAMLVTDELNQNTLFINNKDCVFINHEPEYIVSKVMELFFDKNKLFEISQSGLNILRKVSSSDYQMTPRLNLISKYLNN